MIYEGVCYDGPREGQHVAMYVRRWSSPVNPIGFYRDYITGALDQPVVIRYGYYHWSAPLRKWVYES